MYTPQYTLVDSNSVANTKIWHNNFTDENFNIFTCDFHGIDNNIMIKI